jgi:isopenicillin N synthase-like dioxygenase
MSNIPVIDIFPLVSSSSEQTKFNVSQAIRRACETVGFFQVIGHGIDERLIDRMIIEARRFFAQSPEGKQRYAVHKWNPSNPNKYRGYFPSSANGKEGLDLASPYLNPEHDLVKKGDPLHELNRWPMDGVLTQYWDQMCKFRFMTSSFMMKDRKFERIETLKSDYNLVIFFILHITRGEKRNVFSSILRQNVL